MRSGCLESKDLNAVGAIADTGAPEKRSATAPSYIINRYINYSNYCILSCQVLLVSARKKRDADGFELTVEQICAKGAGSLETRHHRTAHRWRAASIAAFSYYTDMLKALAALDAPAPCSAAVPAASSSSVSLPDNGKTGNPRTGTARELAGEDACATPNTYGKRSQVASQMLQPRLKFYTSPGSRKKSVETNFG